MSEGIKDEQYFFDSLPDKYPLNKNKKFSLRIKPPNRKAITGDSVGEKRIEITESFEKTDDDFLDKVYEEVVLKNNNSLLLEESKVQDILHTLIYEGVYTEARSKEKNESDSVLIVKKLEMVKKILIRFEEVSKILQKNNKFSPLDEVRFLLRLIEEQLTKHK
ncbi:MAG: hypothetical protein WC070_02395 [Candidatus Magasanikbacteria bacterium]